jgi:hypothetical protein
MTPILRLAVVAADPMMDPCVSPPTRWSQALERPAQQAGDPHLRAAEHLADPALLAVFEILQLCCDPLGPRWGSDQA